MSDRVPEASGTEDAHDAHSTHGTLGGTPERPALFFANPAEWAAWLEVHHASETALWMGLKKKHVVDRGLVWEAAVVEALRFGWIDSQVQRIDEDAVRQRWTPRKKSSVWSAINLQTVERLLAEGRMHPAGVAAYDARRDDRQRIYTYETEHAQFPPEFEALLRADPVASAFWDAATAGYRRIATNWVVTAKQEATRASRMDRLVADCSEGVLISTQRYGVEPVWVARARQAGRRPQGRDAPEHAPNDR
jgi:uncharacterized protein YdeI (YjbR/CyaY-like superfamily)